jgi:hypothetical protein
MDTTKNGLIPGHNVHGINQAGMDAGAREIELIAPGAVDPMIVELVLNMVRSDLTGGNEERAMKDLRQILDLTGTYRVLAAMIIASEQVAA